MTKSPRSGTTSERYELLTQSSSSFSPCLTRSVISMQKAVYPPLCSPARRWFTNISQTEFTPSKYRKCLFPPTADIDRLRRYTIVSLLYSTDPSRKCAFQVCGTETSLRGALGALFEIGFISQPLSRIVISRPCARNWHRKQESRIVARCLIVLVLFS